MAGLTVAVYCGGAAITAGALATLQARRGRWDRSLSDHLVVAAVALTWPLAVALFVFFLAQHIIAASSDSEVGR